MNTNSPQNLGGDELHIHSPQSSTSTWKPHPTSGRSAAELEFYSRGWNKPPMLPRNSNHQEACGVGIYGNINGLSRYEHVTAGLNILRRMNHRGATGADNATSDGVGIMVDIPHELYKEELANLPPKDEYGVGVLFIPKSKEENGLSWQETISYVCLKEGFDLFHWRIPPINESVLGPKALSTAPKILQFFVKLNESDSQSSDPQAGEERSNLENKLYLLRRSIEETFKAVDHPPYISTLSSETIVYKGLMLSHHIELFYEDLQNPLHKSRFSMVHQRFSTNTVPAWKMAQPFRRIAHNGEINTLRGNVSNLISRENTLAASDQNHVLSKFTTCVDSTMSDSGIFDSAIDRDLIFTNDIESTLLGFSPDPFSFFEETVSENSFTACKALCKEPWDGPALIGFYFHGILGAKLDRNGLRPARFTLCKDGTFLISSENGVVQFEDSNVVERTRLAPGQMVSVDLKNAKVSTHENIREKLDFEYKSCQPMVMRLDEDSTTSTADENLTSPANLNDTLAGYYYCRDEIDSIIRKMGETGKEPVGSMGNDLSLAFLSKKPRLLYDYFKQIFAQVTNPAIDSIRERMKTSTEVLLGGSLLENESPKEKSFGVVKSPILGPSTFELIKKSNEFKGNTAEIEIFFDDICGLESGLDAMIQKADHAIARGARILILKDPILTKTKSAVPTLVAVSVLHNYLVSVGLRNQVSIISETKEARQVHHFACLLAYGANAIFPTTVYDILNLDRLSCARFVDAATDGVRKILSKYGISTVHSYIGSQSFEIVGIAKETSSKLFGSTPSRVGGITLKTIELEAIERKKLIYSGTEMLENQGILSWRRDGESRLHSPDMIAKLRHSISLKSASQFLDFCKTTDDQNKLVHLRGQLSVEIKKSSNPKNISSATEEIDSIARRFTTGAMSYGSISKEAHETIAIGMNRIKARSNSGEGGEDPTRSIRSKNGDLKRSAIKQIASGRFGVSARYLVDADEIQIKIAQGAKPGEGGQLPGHKVDYEIAKVRGSTAGVTLISPPPHHDIYSIEDLAQLIFDLKTVNPHARISVKLVSGTGIGTIACGVAKAGADVIIISGGDGGTGASPLNSIHGAGLPWEIGLSEVHQTLTANHLRQRVRLQVDGGLRTPKDMLIASILGAQEWGLGSVALIAIGCIMMRKCHLNTCPVGIATQNPRLRALFNGQPDQLVTYVLSLAQEIRNTLVHLNVPSIEALIGRTDLINVVENQTTKKYSKLDFSQILAPGFAYVSTNESVDVNTQPPREVRFDEKYLIPAYQQWITSNKAKKEFVFTSSIENLDRSAGTGLSGYLEKIKLNHFLEQKTYQPLPSIALRFKGTAGQSFMAFGSQEITAVLTGEANDYVGKGLSGGTIVIKPETPGKEQVLAGNVALYGATAGSCFIAGKAGERFAVRNSGALAVVEGVGEHGLEYMTGGTVIVLGEVGHNFAAGMSGGISYVFDPLDELTSKTNKEMVSLDKNLTNAEYKKILEVITLHARLTGSVVAEKVLLNWQNLAKCFTGVKPRAYMDALASQNKIHQIQIPTHRIAAQNFSELTTVEL